MRAPAGQSVPVDGVQQCLRDRFEEVVGLLFRRGFLISREDQISKRGRWAKCKNAGGGNIRWCKTYQIRFPQPLTGPKQLIARGPGDDEVLCEINATDAIEPAYERFPRRVVDAGDDGTDEIRAEALLVQAGRDQIGHRLRRDLAFLAQPVHVDLVAEQIRHGGHVGGEARQAEVDVAVREYFGEIVGYGQGLEAEPKVACDGHAVFADHGHTGTAICETGRC